MDEFYGVKFLSIKLLKILLKKANHIGEIVNATVQYAPHRGKLEKIHIEES